MDLQKLLSRRTKPNANNAVAPDQLQNVMKSRLSASNPNAGDLKEATKRRLRNLAKP